MTGFFSKLFGRKVADRNKAENTSSSSVDTQSSHGEGREAIITLDDPRYDAYYQARRNYWAELGIIDDDVLAYAISPQFMGAPHWPTTRQSFLVIRRPSSVIIASDGLSDLFVDTDMADAGFGSEVYIEVDELMAADFATIRDSWAFSLIESFARNVANWGGLNSQLDKYGVMSTEMPAPGSFPDRWKAPNDSAGVIVNLPIAGRASHLQLDAINTIRMIPITLITPDELAWAVSGGAAARAALSDALLNTETGAVSTLNRQSVPQLPTPKDPA